MEVQNAPKVLTSTIHKGKVLEIEEGEVSLSEVYDIVNLELEDDDKEDAYYIITIK